MDLSNVHARPQRIVFPWQNSVVAKHGTCVQSKKQRMHKILHKLRPPLKIYHEKLDDSEK